MTYEVNDLEDGAKVNFDDLIELTANGGIFQLTHLKPLYPLFQSIGLRTLNLNTHCSLTLIQINKAISYLYEGSNHPSEKLLIARLEENFQRLIKAIIVIDERTINDIARDVIELTELLRLFKINPSKKDSWLHNYSFREFGHSKVARAVSDSGDLPSNVRRSENREYEFHSNFLHPTPQNLEFLNLNSPVFELQATTDFYIHVMPILDMLLTSDELVVDKEFLDFHLVLLNQFKEDENSLKESGLRLPSHENYIKFEKESTEEKG